MDMVGLIEKKKNQKRLLRSEIQDYIRALSAGKIPDYQSAALLMAIRLNGMSLEETIDLAEAMRDSGEKADLSDIEGIKVDKHSTGGVGDTTTLISIPIAAACGVPVAKMSGRGLGHTGGTFDKLESIPNYSVNLSPDCFKEVIQKCGCSIIGQTAKLAPADKILYALRDVTATVDSLPLIASSIMSKKLASGSDALILDVKTGNGALLPTHRQALELAKTMQQIGEGCGLRCGAIITDMNQPLGKAVGNSLEVIEVCQILQTGQKGRLTTVALQLAAAMILLGKKADGFESALTLATEALQSGRAFAKLQEMVQLHGGQVEALSDPTLLPTAPYQKRVVAPRSGVIHKIQTNQIGMAAMCLGAGRAFKEDEIDLSVGLVMQKELGDRVQKGEPLATFYFTEEQKALQAEKIFLNAFELSDAERKEEVPLIYESFGLTD